MPYYFRMGNISNTHHRVWGSINVNPRGNISLDSLALTRLDILKRENES